MEKTEIVANSTVENFTGSGSITFKGHIDQNGKYHEEQSRMCFGVTLKYTAKITSPNGNFDTIRIQSSAGSDNIYYNLATGVELSGELKTKRFVNTKIMVDVFSVTLKETDFECEIDYSF